MAFVPSNEEILSKDEIVWISNGEAGDESVTNRPINNVANFTNSVKEYAIFSDPTKKGLTQQTISYPLNLNSYLGLSGGETGGLRFINNLGDSNDSAKISLSNDGTGNQFFKFSSLNDSGDQIHLEVPHKDSVKVLINDGTTTTINQLWHSGNGGLDSGLDADKLQGQYPDSFNSINTVVKRNSSGNFAANIITANKFEGNSTNVTGVIGVTHGGTGFNVYTYGDMTFANSDSTLEKISIGNAKEYLVSTGKGSAPIWKRIESSDLLDDTVIQPKNGGTGTIGLTGILFGNNQNAFTVASSTQISSAIGSTYVQNANYATVAGAIVAGGTYVGTSFNEITGLSNSSPLMDGTLTIGTSTSVARADHRHPSDTTKANLSGAAFTGVISIIDGTELTPGISFKDDTDTGLFRTGSGNFSISCNNTSIINFTPSNISIQKPLYVNSSISAQSGSFSGSITGSSAVLSGNLVVSSSNAQAGGIILSDDGDIVDMNDGYCSMRFTAGVIVKSGNRTGDGRIWLRSDGQILATNNIIGYYSDERLKEKTGIIENPIEKVKSLEGFYYKENEIAKSFGFKNNNQQIALSAQDVQKVVPEAVSLAPFDMEMDEKGNCKSKSGNDYLTVDYAKMVPLLIEAIKEQQKQIEDLQKIIKG